MRRYALQTLMMAMLAGFVFTLWACDSGGDDAGPAAVEPEEENLSDGLVAIGGACDGLEGCEGCVAPCAKEEGKNVICTPDDLCQDASLTTGADCGYDDELRGKNIGDHIKNYGMWTVDGEPHSLHQDCGEEHKVLWMILATGWCGACESYAKTVEAYYQLYHDQGLEVLWVLGSTDNHDELVTPEWAKEYAEKKNVSFTIVRDYKFGGTYGALSNFSSSLPHQYVMDSTNMELLVGTGGTVNIEPEQAVCLALGVDWLECKKAVCDAMGKTEAQCNYNGPDAEVNNAENGEGAPPE